SALRATDQSASVNRLSPLLPIPTLSLSSPVPSSPVPASTFPIPSVTSGPGCNIPFPISLTCHGWPRPTFPVPTPPGRSALLTDLPICSAWSRQRLPVWNREVGSAV